MDKADTMNALVAVVLLVVGILVIVGRLAIPFFEMILGIGVIIIGILMILETIRGPKWLGIAMVAFGVILLATQWLGTVAGYLEIAANVVVGAGLIILAILKIMNRW